MASLVCFPIWVCLSRKALCLGAQVLVRARSSLCPGWRDPRAGRVVGDSAVHPPSGPQPRDSSGLGVAPVGHSFKAKLFSSRVLGRGFTSLASPDPRPDSEAPPLPRCLEPPRR